MTAEDVYEMLRKIRYDLTAAQGKLTDVFSMLGELNLQDTPAHVCDRCGVKIRASALLAEHVYNSHAGPVPEHWERIEAMSPEEDVCVCDKRPSADSVPLWERWTCPDCDMEWIADEPAPQMLVTWLPAGSWSLLPR